MSTLRDALMQKRKDIVKSFTVTVDVDSEGQVHMGEPQDVIDNPGEMGDLEGHGDGEGERIMPDGTVEGSDLAPPLAEGPGDGLVDDEADPELNMEALEMLADRETGSRKPNSLREHGAVVAKNKIKEQKDRKMSQSKSSGFKKRG